MKSILLVSMFLFVSFQANATSCIFHKQVLVREANNPNAEWKLFTPAYSIEITEEVYGVVTGYFNDLTWKDYWFSPIKCLPNGVKTNITFEFDEIPINLPPSPTTIWQNDFTFPYNHLFQFHDQIGNKQFVFKFMFVKNP